MTITTKHEAYIEDKLSGPDAFFSPADGIYPTGKEWDRIVKVTPDDDLKTMMEETYGRADSTCFLLAPGRYSIGTVKMCGNCAILSEESMKATITRNGDWDSVYFMYGDKTGYVQFIGLVIEGSGRSAVITNPSRPKYHLDFIGCLVDGGYHHNTQSGDKSKWGLMIHQWYGVVAYTTIKNIKDEHCIYAHTMEEDSLVYKSRMGRCGATCIQMVGREDENGFSPFQLDIVDSDFFDAGLKAGGSAITFQGTKRLVIKDSRLTLGADKEYRDEYLAHSTKKHFGTGLFANWTEENAIHPWPRDLPTEEIVFDNVDFLVDPNDGDRAVVILTNVELVTIVGEVRVHPGNYNKHALKIWEGIGYDSSNGKYIAPPWAKTEVVPTKQ